MTYAHTNPKVNKQQVQRTIDERVAMLIKQEQAAARQAEQEPSRIKCCQELLKKLWHCLFGRRG